jgi:hypothetical protein
MPISNGSVPIVIQEKLNTDLKQLPCSFTSTKNYEVAYFSKIYYQTSFQDTILSGTRITPTSEVCVSTMLSIVGDLKAGAEYSC